MTWSEQLMKVYERLTLSGVLLGILAGFSGIFLFWVYEQRAAVFITVTGSPFALLAIAAVMLLVCMAWVAYMFVAMAGKDNKDKLDVMRLRIDAAEEYSRKQDKEIERLHQVLTKTVLDERRACAQQIDQLVAVMNAHGIIVERRHDGDRRHEAKEDDRG